MRRGRNRFVLGVGVVLGVSGASVGLAASLTRYSGHTSQGRTFPVTLTIDAAHRLAFAIKYGEQCYTPTHRRAGPSRGTFGFRPVGGRGLTPDRHGRFSRKITLDHQLTTERSEYFNAIDKVRGRITGKTAAGTFSFDGRFYERGRYLGSCLTGTLRWSVHRR